MNAMVHGMADFLPAFEAMLLNEGGYKLTDIAGDRGGQTYAGIARKSNPNWPGWIYIDRGDTPPASLVRAFYREEFWDRLCCDDIEIEAIARSLFDFSFDGGVKKATVKNPGEFIDGSLPGCLGIHMYFYDFGVFKLTAFIDKIVEHGDAKGTPP